LKRGFVLKPGDELFETIGAALPEGALLREPGLRRRELRDVELAGSDAALLAGADQAAAFQQADVLQEGRQGHGERPGELAHTRRPLAQPPDDGPARGIGEGVEDAAQRLVMLIHTAKYRVATLSSMGNFGRALTRA